jgi:hypothetical protein
VDVHIPQAGDEVTTCGLDQVCIDGYPDLVGPAHRYDAIACDKNCLLGPERPIHHIDDGDITDRHGWGPG